MKKLILTFMTLLSLNAYANHEEDAEPVYTEIVVDFESKYLEESTVLMCDDSYASGVDVVILGERPYHL